MFFLSVMVAGLLALFPVQKAEALAAYVRFLNRYNAMLTGLEITQADRDSGDLNDDLEGLTIAQINQIIDAQLTDAQMVDSNINDDTLEYVNSDDNCETKLGFSDGDNQWEMTRIGIVVSGRGCVELTPGKDWVLGGPAGSANIDVTEITTWFRWDNANTMSRVDGKDGQFVEDPLQPGRYFRIEETGDNDQDYVELNSGVYDSGYYRKNGDTGFPIAIGSVDNRREAPTDYDDAANNAGSLTPQEDKSCENTSGPLGWIFCSVIRVTDGALNWMDSRIQGLLAINKNKYQDNAGLFVAWTQIRNIAYIILIPIMLVMVIGTAVGVEAFSAYTVKRALPRMVAAVIFITFSWYITSFMITFTNVVGGGILGLLTAPFTLQPGNIPAGQIQLSSLFGPGQDFISMFLTNAAIAAAVVVIVWLFLGTMVLVVLTAFLILLLRQMFIIALMLVAPLAILAWIFPGNDKFWKMWWDAFTKLLLMFPIIMAVIAVGRIFAVIILSTDNGGFDGVDDEILIPLMAVTAYVIPYAFIPFTFKLAGGLFSTLTGMVNDRQKGLLDRQKENRAHKTERAGRKVLQRRANTVRRLEDYGNKGGFVGRNAARFAAKRVGGYNMEAAMSAKNAQVSKEIQDQIATGKDDDIRGLTASYAYDYYKKHGQQAAIGQGLMEVGADGSRKFKSLGGQMVGESNVIAGQKRWGNDRFAQQAALSYEMRKAMTSEQVGDLSKNYSGYAQSMGMTDSEAAGAWIGSAFENQNQHLEYKSTDWKTGNLKNNGEDFVKEVYEKKGSYPLAQMSGHTIERLQESYTAAQRTEQSFAGRDEATLSEPERATLDNARTQRGRVREIAETFVQRGGGVQGMAGEGDAAVPIVGRGGGATVSAPGSASVNEKVQELARMTGVAPESQPRQPAAEPPDWRNPQGYM